MIKVGADVELGLQNHEGTLVSSIGKIGGSKHRPLLVEGGNLQEDNVLAEFAIDPASSEDDFYQKITQVYGTLRLKMQELQLKPLLLSSLRYPMTELMHPRAMEFGCEPDFDAWTMSQNIPPDPFQVMDLRTCGGHLHVGWDVAEDDIESKVRLIKMMDLFLGVPSVLLDGDTDRRSMYGKAGAHRPKSYGVEYRSLSSFWIKDESHIRWAYQQTLKAFQHKDQEVSDLIGNRSDDLAEIINRSDTKGAEELVAQYGIQLPEAA